MSKVLMLQVVSSAFGITVCSLYDAEAMRALKPRPVVMRNIGLENTNLARHPSTSVNGAPLAAQPEPKAPPVRQITKGEVFDLRPVPEGARVALAGASPRAGQPAAEQGVEMVAASPRAGQPAAEPGMAYSEDRIQSGSSLEKLLTLARAAGYNAQHPTENSLALWFTKALAENDTLQSAVSRHAKESTIVIRCMERAKSGAPLPRDTLSLLTRVVNEDGFSTDRPGAADLVRKRVVDAKTFIGYTREEWESVTSGALYLRAYCTDFTRSFPSAYKISEKLWNLVQAGAAPQAKEKFFMWLDCIVDFVRLAQHSKAQTAGNQPYHDWLACHPGLICLVCLCNAITKEETEWNKTNVREELLDLLNSCSRKSAIGNGQFEVEGGAIVYNDEFVNKEGFDMISEAAGCEFELAVDFAPSLLKTFNPDMVRRRS